MTELRDGLEFLDNLRRDADGRGKRFDDLSGYLEQRAREKGVPIQGQFELTPLCNFDCKMCYAHLSPEQLQEKILTTQQWKDLIHQAYEEGMYKAALTGGECLTYPGFEELYLYLHELGCEVSVLTNGLLLSEKWVKFFKEHMPALIQITLYGHDDDSYERVTGHRAFKTVCQNIERVRDAELPLQVAITPNQYLGNAVFDTVRTAKKLCRNVQINSALFAPREETGRAEQQDDMRIDDYIEIYKLQRKLDGQEVREIPEDKLPKPGGEITDCASCGLRCGGARSSFVIDWKGRLMPCNQLEHVEAFPLRDGFKQAWKEINHIAENWPRVRECEHCPYDPVCDNCAAVMLRYAKPGERPVKLCEQTRHKVSCGIWQIADCE